jgi:hypothetical protein
MLVNIWEDMFDNPLHAKSQLKHKVKLDFFFCSFYLNQHATWCKIIVVFSPPPPSPSIGFSCEIMIHI